MRYLLDTNVITEVARPLPDRALLDRISERSDDCAVPATAWHEAWYGAQRLPPSKRRQRLEGILLRAIKDVFPVLPYDGAAAEWHAEERARLVAAGRTPPEADAQIAAIAVVNDLTLVTRNTRDFADFRHLRVASWHSP